MWDTLRVWNTVPCGIPCQGTQWDPVRDVKHTGIKFVATRYTYAPTDFRPPLRSRLALARMHMHAHAHTLMHARARTHAHTHARKHTQTHARTRARRARRYMDAHAVPSAGDWALDRNGAIFLQGACVRQLTAYRRAAARTHFTARDLRMCSHVAADALQCSAAQRSAAQRSAMQCNGRDALRPRCLARRPAPHLHRDWDSNVGRQGPSARCSTRVRSTGSMATP